ncbi:9998_t:CDS:2, partial [Cetraspora pellucida]
MDKHAHIPDPEAKILIEVYQMIAGHKEVYAKILEISSNELSEQIAQIHEIVKLREFANNVLNKKTIQEEWSKEKNQELKQYKENYEEILTVSIGMQFEESAIIDLAKQIRCMMIHAQKQKRQDSKEIEKGLRQLKYRLQTIENNYKYVSNLPNEEVESHLETAEKAARVKINDKEEDRKKALYDKNLIKWNHKKQQVAIRNFLIKSEFATENMKKQFQAKYKELLGSLLEKQGQMLDNDNLDERLKKDQQMIRGKPQSETFPPEGATRNRYKLKENIYRERPSLLASDDKDFKLAKFINKNVINPLFRRHLRNSNTTSLLQIPFKLKNELNSEEDEEFKLQNPPISRLKKQRSIVSTTSNQSSNTDKWRKNREIRKKMFEEKDDTKDYYENQYNNQDEIGKSSKQQRHKDIDTRIIEIPWNGQPAQYPVARNSNLTDEHGKKHMHIHYQKVPDSKDEDSLYAHFKKMPVEVRYIILPTIIEENPVDYKVYCNENIEVPPMNIGHIRIENPVENGYIGTPVNLAKKGII